MVDETAALVATFNLCEKYFTLTRDYGFITTDAALDAGFARAALRRAVGDSFNMIAVDGDTSTNDMVLLLANGLAGNRPLRFGTTDGRLFEAALREVCTYLAKCVDRDGEGATRLIEVEVAGAATKEDARLAARTVVNSSLVKAAVHGADPNWGRIVAAVGRSGAQVDSQGSASTLGTSACSSRALPWPSVTRKPGGCSAALKSASPCGSILAVSGPLPGAATCRRST